MPNLDELGVARGEGAGRTDWNESDVASLAADERALALLAFQIRAESRTISRTSELFELWLRRPESVEDYDGTIYKPSRTGLTYSAFVGVWRELGRRVEAQQIAVPEDILARHPDIDRYIPRE